MKFHAKSPPSYFLQTAYKRMESAFIKTVKSVTISEVFENANVKYSHVIYKVKLEGSDAIDVQSRIAPGFNKDVLRFELQTASITCHPTRNSIFLSFARIKQWTIVRIDVESAFV